MFGEETPSLQAVSLELLGSDVRPGTNGFIWKNILGPGEVALLTGPCKVGKTTLVTGLLRALADGSQLLERPTHHTTVWIVSEESVELWQQRLRSQPIGSHVQLLSRPFRGNPTPQQWMGLIDAACDANRVGRCGLLVLDPLACFLPDKAENDSNLLLDTLRGLHRLTLQGAAVLLLHHPKKSGSAGSISPRGPGVLQDFADVSMTLTNAGKDPARRNIRHLTVEARRNGSHEEIVYAWCSKSGAFSICYEMHPATLERHWSHLKTVLQRQASEVTVEVIRAEWPEEAPIPGKTWLYRLLKAAEQNKRIVRTGSGNKHEPYRYRLSAMRDDDR